MPLNLIDPPKSRLLRWFIANKSGAADYFDALFQVSRTVVTLTVNGIPHRAFITGQGEINITLGQPSSVGAAASTLTPPPKAGRILRWVIKQKESVAKYVRAMQQVSSLRMTVTVNGVPHKTVITYNGRNAELRLNLGTVTTI